MKTAVIINYLPECDSSQKIVVNETLNAIGRCRVTDNTNSFVGIEGTLTDKEKDYLQDIGNEMHVEYIFLECPDDYEGDKRTDTFQLR